MIRARSSKLRLIVLFGIVFSLAGLPGSLGKDFVIPKIGPAHAIPAPGSCQLTPGGPTVECWYPAGSAMDTEQISISDGISEYQCLLSPNPCIDLTDFPAEPSTIPSLMQMPNTYLTSQIIAHAYYELEFNLANTYWGISMNFGNDFNGLQLRQGIAHLLNKTSFTANQASIAGTAIAIDNPIPAASSFGGSTVPTPNPCGWDTLYPEFGSRCNTGASGGLAYNCSFGSTCPSGTFGAIPPSPWQAQIGSADFCASAVHFKNALNGGVFKTSRGVSLAANCVLLAPGQLSPGVGWPSNVTSFPVNVFARSDSPARLALGTSYAQEICALFTGAYSTGCSPFVTFTQGTSSTFCGAIVPPQSLQLCWQVYTGAFEDVFPFDQSLYFTYNSKFTAVPLGTPCNSTSSNPAPSDYMYLCNSSYDIASNQVEFASGISSSLSAATNAMNIFGQGAYTIPVLTREFQFGYLSNWQRVINGDGVGIPNFFTWLDAYSPNPAITGTIRQGFDGTTRSLNPYGASTIHDFYVLNNVYDRLSVPNPASNSQLLDWMTINTVPIINSNLPYVPPAGTVLTYRFTLRSDIFWQDNRPVTSWDVKFSYLTFNATGSFQGSSLSTMTGITILSPNQFDVNLNSGGPFALYSLVSPTIVPGRYWSGTCPSSSWDGKVAAGMVPDNCMAADSAKTSSAFDPVSAGILIGSGPWKCVNRTTGVLGGGCSSSGIQNPPLGGSYTFTRFGIGHVPGSSLSDDYFRSLGSLALWFWSEASGDLVRDFLQFSIIAKCFGQPPSPLDGIPPATSCAHWQQGIGANGGPIAIGPIQMGIYLRFIGVNWVHPFDWWINPPTGIAPPPPKLAIESYNLLPAVVAGCSQPYPTGGYDC